MKLSVHIEEWELSQPFRISNFEWVNARGIVVQLAEAGCLGRGEAQGVFYLVDPDGGETRLTDASEILTPWQFSKMWATPELILAIFVPPLIFEAAFHLELSQLRENLTPILSSSPFGTRKKENRIAL